jgi:hypothetical protein
MHGAYNVKYSAYVGSDVLELFSLYGMKNFKIKKWLFVLPSKLRIL